MIKPPSVRIKDISENFDISTVSVELKYPIPLTRVKIVKTITDDVHPCSCLLVLEVFYAGS